MKIKYKGFTIVELLIVIAILAILSTVSIIGYGSFTKNANESNDIVKITQLNELASAESIFDDELTANDIVNSAIANGERSFDTNASDTHIVWDTKTKKFLYINENNEVVNDSTEYSDESNWMYIEYNGFIEFEDNNPLYFDDLFN